MAGEWGRFIEPTGPWWMWLITGVLLVSCLFIGRPYCRWICPYGAVLGACSRAAKKPVTVMPNDCCDCELCEDACPFGAIEQHRARPSFCLACTRCYTACPMERSRRGLAVEETAPAAAPPPPPPQAPPSRTPATAPRIKPAAEEEDLSYIDELVASCGTGKAAALPILQAIQARHRYLPRTAMQRVC
jgi:NAD-dependent dihydropyrimidine dehydrogenase PreA subunit